MTRGAEPLPRDDQQQSENTEDSLQGAQSNLGPGKYRDPKVILDEMLECIHLILRYTDGILKHLQRNNCFRMPSSCALLFWVKRQVIFLMMTKHDGLLSRGVSLPTCGTA